MKLEIGPVPLATGQTRLIEAGGRSLLVCRSVAGLHVTDALCPHQKLSLDGARVRGGYIMCPHHGARFALSDGASATPMTPLPLAVYPCEESDDGLTVELP